MLESHWYNGWIPAFAGMTVYMHQDEKIIEHGKVTMALQFKGNGKLIVIWLVVTLVLMVAGGAVTGAIAPGSWPGYVVSGIGAGCTIWLIQRLSRHPGTR